MKHDKFDLEGELRASRPQPRVDFARALADEVRSRPTERSRLGRVGLSLALSGLIVVALASFGGVGYASSTASQAVKKVERATTPKHVRIVSNSAAQAQYAPFTPPKPKAQAARATASARAQAAAPPKVTTSQLPFTGLALWVPLAIGLLMIAFGLVLRTRSRRRSSGAH
jgi:hypothetical protein